MLSDTPSAVDPSDRSRRRLARTLLALAAAAALACGGAERPAPTAAAETQRELRSGAVVGALGRFGDHVWRGIPFAAPPVGALRWRAPRPEEHWEGVRLALEDPPRCPQYAISDRDGAKAGEPTGSEDCLALNVFAPPFAPGALPRGAARLPVMVWIHGGGNSIGDARFYDGGRLATEQQLILVVVQYRLGPFGWFRNAALRDADATPEDASGNFGTLDLIRALHWVQENAEAFGGDPGNVTIFGESAGGRNVYTLLQSPLAAGLFQRAVSESGALSFATLAEAEHPADAAEPGHENSSSEVLLRLLVADGDAKDRAAAAVRAQAMSPAERAAFLRSRSPEQVLGAYAGARTMGMIRMPQVFPDGVVLPDEPAAEQFRSGHYNRVPVVLGSNRDEMRLFMLFDPHYLQRRLGFIPVLRDPEAYRRDTGWVSRAWKLAGVDDPARWMLESGAHDVFAYRFDWDEEPSLLWIDGPLWLGAAHGLEVPFVFGDFDLPVLGGLFRDSASPGHAELSRRMRSYWSQFAYTGDPGRGRARDLPEWSAWREDGPDSPRYLVLDTEQDAGVRMDAHAETAEGLVDGVMTDGRFADLAERCAVLSAMSRWRGLLDAARVRAAGCPAEATDR